jgi:hypothetical protein
MTDDTEACEAVHGYLFAQFPGADIWDRHDPDPPAHTWGVEERHVAMQLTVSFEFLRAFAPDGIASQLTAWRADEELRAAGATRRVVVTTTGLRTESRK